MEKYSLLRTIGEGSFGRALLVRCKNSEQYYVLKEIPLPKNVSKSEHTRREAALLSKMSHSNIVAFRESFENNGLLCIVMEYCSGGDLLQRIQSQKNELFSVENVLKWFAQMCSGVKHIHDQRVLHRDLKSKNIFLTGTGTVKLGDFGSACVLNSPKAFAQTYVGTPFYVAPEIWDNQPYNNKSDVWSLACVLYELCTLQHPFQASSWKSLILKVCRGSYPPLPTHLPYEVHYLLKNMFKTDPKDRPSLRTILTSHRISKLLRSHLPPEAVGSAGRDRETSEVRERRRIRRWDPEEGQRVAEFLGQKTLMQTSEDVEGSRDQSASDERHHRKQWSPSDSVLRKMAAASLKSTEPGTSAVDEERGASEDQKKKRRRRRRWDRDPPQRLLSLLEKAPLHKAFSTVIIRSAGADAVTEPQPDAHGDHTDGPSQDDVEDERLQPRSDDDDTDFEEESHCEWMDELEKMFSQN